MTREQKIAAVESILLDVVRTGTLDLDARVKSIVDLLDPEREPGTTDDKLRPGQTVKEALDRCIEVVGERRKGEFVKAEKGSMDVVREFALAVTAMEDAQMRYARGRHMQEGSFSPSDVDRWLADGQDVQATVDERDRAAGKGS